VARVAGTGRSAASRLSTPHSPQPVRPAMLRRRSCSAAMRWFAIWSWTSMPRPPDSILRSSTSMS